MKVKKNILILNAFLILVIAVILIFQFYERDVEFDCNFDAKPSKLLEIVSRKFPEISIRDVSVLFVFNQLPSKSDVEAIEKLHSILKDDITVLTLFNRRFKYNRPIKFPYKFLSHLKILCRSKKKAGEETVGENYFLLLKNKKIQYIDKKIDLGTMAFLIQKKLNPQLGYNDFAISTEDLRKKILQRLKKGELHLWRLNPNREETLPDLAEISRLYFIHASCSTCQLKSLFSKIKLKQIVDDRGRPMAIFSVFADRFKLTPILKEINVNLPIYLDVNDEFDLFSTIFNDRDSPLIIDLKKWR